MATMTNEQIEQKKQLLAEKMKQAKALYDELVDAGAIELSEDELDQAAGGLKHPIESEDWNMPLGGALI